MWNVQCSDVVVVKEWQQSHGLGATDRFVVSSKSLNELGLSVPVKKYSMSANKVYVGEA
jgi:hypothetical protein